jgi:hypothetical protein
MTADPFATSPDASPTLLDPQTGKPLPGVKGYSPEPTPRTLADARLLKAYYRDPRGGTYYQAKVRWMQEARDFLKWPKATVTERRMRLYRDWQTLTALLEESDGELERRGWDGPKYWAMFQRSRAWLGQIHGLDEAMANRKEPEAPGSSGSRFGLGQST